MQFELPSSMTGFAQWLFIVVAVVLIGIVAIYAVNALLAVGTLAVVLVVGGFLLWIVGGRIVDALRHGKPLIRGDWGGEE